MLSTPLILTTTTIDIPSVLPSSPQALYYYSALRIQHLQPIRYATLKTFVVVFTLCSILILHCLCFLALFKILFKFCSLQCVTLTLLSAFEHLPVYWYSWQVNLSTHLFAMS